MKKYLPGTLVFNPGSEQDSHSWWGVILYKTKLKYYKIFYYNTITNSFYFGHWYKGRREKIIFDPEKIQKKSS